MGANSPILAAGMPETQHAPGEPASAADLPLRLRDALGRRKSLASAPAGDWKLPLISWTVRNADDRATVAAHADQMIFEGFDPEAV